MFWAYTAMLSRLEAERSVVAINDQAVAAGTMKDDARRKYLREIEQTLDGDRKPQRAPKATLDRLRQIGVGMREPQPRGEVKS